VFQERWDECHQPLIQIAKKIRRTLDQKLIWQQTVDGLGTTLHASRCIICPYSSGSQELLVVAEYCCQPFSSMLGKFLHLMEEPGLIQAIATLEPVVLELDWQSDRFERGLVLTIPIYYQNQPNAIICLHQCATDRDSLLSQWSAVEIALVQELAEQIGMAIAHTNLRAELVAASQQAEEATRIKSEFLNNISHELRTPLNKIICSLKVILDDIADDPEEQLEFINYAHHSALDLLKLINDILAIGKLKADKIQMDLEPVNLNELLNDVERCMRPQTQEKQLNLLIQTPTYKEIILYGNYRGLLQMFLNIIDNSIKFNREGGGITISTKAIEKKLVAFNQELPGMVEIAIADTGMGMSPHKQEKIFSIFTKGDASRTTPHPGTGIGLTLSQKLIEAMGGEISFFSPGEGEGATVTFTVPLYRKPIPYRPDILTESLKNTSETH